MCKSKRHFRKKTKTLTGVLSKHQGCDNRRRVPSRKASMGGFDNFDGNLDIYMRSNVIKKPTVEDFVSANDSEKLHCIAIMNQVQLEQQEQSRSREEEIQVARPNDGCDVDKHEPDKKLRKVIRWCLASITAIGIIWTLKK